MSSEKSSYSFEALILGVLAIGAITYLLVPRIGSIRPIPHHLTSGANLRSIANTYVAYTVGGEKGRILIAKPGDTAHTAAFILAHFCQLNDASMWFLKNDRTIAGQTIPRTVTVGQPPDDKIDPAFAKLTLAYEFAANIPLDAPNTSTPIAWTRGLRIDGTWSADSPWDGKGGHIAYLDGHVVWVDVKLGLGQNDEHFVKYGTQTPTVNIREALPPGAVILSAEPNGAQK